MSLCVVVDGSGAVVVDPAMPANCDQFVLVSSDDYYAMQHSGVLPPLSLTDAAAIANAILFCWVCGWLWGPVSQALDG